MQVSSFGLRHLCLNLFLVTSSCQFVFSNIQLLIDLFIVFFWHPSTEVLKYRVYGLSTWIDPVFWD